MERGRGYLGRVEKLWQKWHWLHSVNLSCVFAADPYPGAPPESSSPPTLPTPGLLTVHLSSHRKDTSCLWWTTGMGRLWDIRAGGTATCQCVLGWWWLDAELGWEVGMNPNEMPKTLCSHQRSVNMEQHVMETPVRVHRDPAVPIPTDTSTCDIRTRLSGNTRLRLLHLLGADNKSSEDGKCLQEPPCSDTRWEGLPGGPNGASLFLVSELPSSKDDARNSHHGWRVCSLSWAAVALCLSQLTAFLNPCWELGFPSVPP